MSRVSITSRNTRGVMLIRLSNDEKLVKTVRIDEPESQDDDSGDDAQSDE
ncbi:hypothetical protein DSL92_08610 [Billgrantia gudaonensis]|uniref:DNA gyrase subunit A n=1 Tax=Billgrantia gudaonensis TaxID=376427 RepID=A0A432JI18_9GAMM|nr:hypothetical protein DSL92_08610 [Halomonas gudaonensis]